MSDFIRRMLDGALILRAPDGDSGAIADAPAGDDSVNPDTGAAAAVVDPATPPVVDDPSATPSAETPAAPPVVDRNQQRMNQLVAERWAERRRAEEAEQRNRLLQEQLNQTRESLAPQVDENGQPVQRASLVRPAAPAQDIQQMAAQIAAQNEFNRQVADEVQKGRTSHKDFDQVASNLQRFGELPRTFVEAAIATGKGADVMYHLGGDIAEADRILSLPPIQQAVALASLAQTIKPPAPPKTITSAPAPFTPRVSGGSNSGTPSLEDENLSMADWIKMREKTLPKRASR